MPQVKKITVIDKNGINHILSVIESLNSPGVYGIVALNPDGSQIGGSNTRINVPTPHINIVSATEFGVTLEAKFNYADRWILDYEPEIYLYFKKTREGSKHHPIAKSHRIAHIPQTDGGGTPISLKQDVNPRLRSFCIGKPFQMDTERPVDGSKNNMNTIFMINPFHFLGSVKNSTAGTGNFPCAKNVWNNKQGTEYPSTFTHTKLSRQTINEKKIKTIVAYIKVVIRNPLGPNTMYPIESDISEAIIIYPRSNEDVDRYGKRGCEFNRHR